MFWILFLFVKIKSNKTLKIHQVIKKIVTHDFHKFKKIGNLSFLKKKVNFLKNVNDNKTYSKQDCPICFSKINTDNIGFTYCGHVFCHSCIVEYNKKYSKKCPLCRTYLTNKKIFKLK